MKRLVSVELDVDQFGVENRWPPTSGEEDDGRNLNETGVEMERTGGRIVWHGLHCALRLHAAVEQAEQKEWYAEAPGTATAEERYPMRDEIPGSHGRKYDRSRDRERVQSEKSLKI